MCGICLHIHSATCRATWIPPTQHSGCLERLKLSETIDASLRRGPDAVNKVVVVPAPSVSADLTGAVLHLRGATITPQPLATPKGGDNNNQESLLCWNGEVFGSSTAKVHLSDGSNDTQLVAAALSTLELRTDLDTVEAFTLEVRDLLEKIAGPFAFVFYSSRWRSFIFSRDPLGRRSLTYHTNDSNTPEEHKMSEIFISSCPLKCPKFAPPPATTTAPVAGAVCVVEGVTEDDELQNSRGKRIRGEEEERDLKQQGVAGGVVEGATEDDELQECWSEVPITGIFRISFPAEWQLSPSNHLLTMVECPWRHAHRTHPLLASRVSPYMAISEDKVAPGAEDVEDELLRRGAQNAIDQLVALVGYTPDEAEVDAPWDSTLRFLAALNLSVCRRVRMESRAEDPTAPITLLFSGGIDSVMLTLLTHLHCHPTTPIELINVAFGDYPDQTPDRVAAQNAFSEMMEIPSVKAVGRDWKLIFVDVGHEEVLGQREAILDLIYPRMTVMDLNIGTAIWFAVRGKGQLVPHHCVQADTRNKFFRTADRDRKKGLGSIGTSAPTETEETAGNVKAAAALPPPGKFDALMEILLFEACRGSTGNEPGIMFSTLGKDYSAQLSSHWKTLGYKKLGFYLNDAAGAGLIKIDGNKALGKFVYLVKEEHIVLVKAAQKQRELQEQELKRAPTYTRKGRVVILGMGADETLGGYVRHARHFDRNGEAGLAEELAKDFTRLWKRNLGRDDRIVSDHGVEGRFPFLDENFLQVVSSLPMSHVVDLRKPSGDKLILRSAARAVGLTTTSVLQKRAIQFGTRIANRKIQGSTPLTACSETDLQNPMTVSK